MHSAVHQTIAAVWRIESARIVAAVARRVRDLGVAEELAQDALVAALEHWPKDGVPHNPGAWLMTTAKNRALDHLRHRQMSEGHHEALAADRVAQQADHVPDFVDALGEAMQDEIGDDLLRLIFTACHPVLGTDARVALTLKLLGGLTTHEIARAFLVPEATIAQRIVRAKAKIRDAGIPYQVPALNELPERLASVLRVIYLVFNEGYSASSGNVLLQQDLSDEAIRLGRLLVQLLPDPEVTGLLALMLLQASRQRARTDAEGNLVLLERQDRSLWDRERIEEGCELVRHALRSRGYGAYTVQAAIAAVHAEAATANDTDWDEIVGLYDVLQGHWPSAVVALNRAVALAKRDGPEAGLAEVEAILAAGELRDYHLVHAASAELHAQLGHVEEARAAWQQALALTRQAPERRHIERRLQALK